MACKIARVRVPIGVIGIIYESRPNVTADAGALAMKSGNAAILRGGSDGFRSSAAIVAALQRGPCGGGPAQGRHPDGADDRSRRRRPDARRASTVRIDLIVPRGGKSLVARVQEEARVPVFSHLEGICHVYVDKARRCSTWRRSIVRQCQDAAHRRLRRRRDDPHRSRLRGDASASRSSRH